MSRPEFYLVDDPNGTSSLSPALLLTPEEYDHFIATGEVPS